MKKRYLIRIGLVCILAQVVATPAFSLTVSWTDWMSSTSNSASGELTVGTTAVGVEYLNTANHAFVQTGTGTNYWTEGSPAPYTSGNVDNAPTAAELIALNAGGTVTVNFAETIMDPYIAMTSWNGNTVEFGVPITVDSSGHGYWGSGTAMVNPGGTGFYGSGEFHGILSLSGAFDSISFTHTSENWHGFTIGVAGLDDGGSGGPGPDPSPVPEPATMLLFGSGLAGLVGLKRRKK